MVVNNSQVSQVAFDVDNSLWTNAKIQAIKRRMLLKDWLAEAIQEKINRELSSQ